MPPDETFAIRPPRGGFLLGTQTLVFETQNRAHFAQKFALGGLTFPGKAGAHERGFSGSCQTNCYQSSGRVPRVRCPE